MPSFQPAHVIESKSVNICNGQPNETSSSTSLKQYQTLLILAELLNDSYRDFLCVQCSKCHGNWLYQYPKTRSIILFNRPNRLKGPNKTLILLIQFKVHISMCVGARRMLPCDTYNNNLARRVWFGVRPPFWLHRKLLVKFCIEFTKSERNLSQKRKECHAKTEIRVDVEQLQIYYLHLLKQKTTKRIENFLWNSINSWNFTVKIGVHIERNKLWKTLQNISFVEIKFIIAN